MAGSLRLERCWPVRLRQDGDGDGHHALYQELFRGEIRRAASLPQLQLLHLPPHCQCSRGKISKVRKVERSKSLTSMLSIVKLDNCDDLNPSHAWLVIANLQAHIFPFSTVHNWFLDSSHSNLLYGRSFIILLCRCSLKDEEDNALDTYVKVSVSLRHQVLKVKRTNRVRADHCPQYSQSFHFNLSESQLGSTP